MPGRESSARRYAQAAFEVAVEDGATEQMQRDIESLASLFAEPDVQKVMESGRIPEAEKLRVVDVALPSLTGEGRNVARLLVRRGRTGIAPLTRDIFNRMLDDREGRARAVVTTAVELTPAEREAVVTRLGELTGRTVDVSTRIDSSILGGMIAQVGDKLLDGSTRTRLQKLRRTMQAAG
jgi:F-type H+-transporting ATPase subunit delta